MDGLINIHTHTMAGRKQDSQLGFRLKPKVGWGGRRKGAGRKPAGAKAQLPHRARPVHSRSHPIHVTLRVVRGMPSLRGKSAFKDIKRAMECVYWREGFRLAHFSVQS